MEIKSSTNPMEEDLLRLIPAGTRSVAEILTLKHIPVGCAEIDALLDDGLQQGGFYLFLGPAKAGKSSMLRSIALTMAETVPVLYLNFEQLGRGTFAAFYQKLTNESLRESVRKDAGRTATENIFKMPGIPLYIAFWTDKLLNRSFNVGIKDQLEASVKLITEMTGVTPVVIMENLSDIYNERIGGQDSLTNVVTQTTLDIRNFCIKNELAMLLAHHTSKLAGDMPTVDDVRDSKRIVDLAHSIFCSWSKEHKDGSIDYCFSMLKSRDKPGSKHFYASYGSKGKIILVPFLPGKTPKV